MFRRLSIKQIIFFTIFSIFNIQSTDVQESKVEYMATCILPYCWTKNGTTLVLLGKERRRFGYAWFDFCGTRDEKDEGPLETAIRELNEETAYQLKLLPTENLIKFFVNYKINPRNKQIDGTVVHFLLPIQYINPEVIKKAVSTGKYKHVEKREWKWIKAQDLLDNKVKDLHFYDLFEYKLKIPEFKKLLEEVIKEGKTRIKSKL